MGISMSRTKSGTVPGMVTLTHNPTALGGSATEIASSSSTWGTWQLHGTLSQNKTKSRARDEAQCEGLGVEPQ